jgi:hypothetical protein
MKAAWALVFLLFAACNESAAKRAPRAAGLCVTKGALKAHGKTGARITEPTVRAVRAGSSGDSASLKFTYRGPSKKSRALASGQMRRQLGLKLRAQDGCNLVYVMWRIEPKPGIEVSIKRNPGKSTHKECGANGYTKVAFVDAPLIEADTEHTLDAALTGADLSVTIDGKEIWTGAVEGAADLTGPAGLRTDNISADVELTTSPLANARKKLPKCPAAGDAD